MGSESIIEFGRVVWSKKRVNLIGVYGAQFVLIGLNDTHNGMASGNCPSVYRVTFSLT